jgi:hypothetical protein
VTWAVAGLVVLAVLALAAAGWCIWTATRLDRLHLKVEAADASLRECLQRRSSLAIELASTGLTDPASAVLLMSAAVDARDNGVDWLAQSRLTYTLRLVDSHGDDALVSDVRAAQREASIARRIRSDLVARTVDLRDRRRVRWFGLAGRAGPPPMVEYDDGDV